MLGKSFGMLVVLVVPSIAFGIPGIAEIELIPNLPPPYFGGESLTVDVWVHSNDTVGHDLRLVQLDIRNEIEYEQLLAAGGTFTQAGGVVVRQIAVLEDGAWSPLGAEGGGPDGTVLTIVNFDDGTGPVLYVGGSFDSAYDCTTCPPIAAANIAMWDGISWSPVGDGFDRTVRALAVYDDGAGPALYAAGDFFYSGSTVVRSIAKWNGVAWSPAGYFGDPANALSVFDDGSGPELYIGGDFTHAFWDPMAGIAKWDSNLLAAVADDLVLGVNTLTVFDDGNGASLYAAGTFTTSATQPLDLVARLDGNTWMPLGTGISGSSMQSSGVFAAPGGDVLVVGGVFSQAGGVAATNVAQWDGISWSALGAGTDGSVNALISYDDGTGRSLYVGGDFQFAGGASHSYIAKWDGTEWSDVSGGMSQTVDVFAIVDGDPLPDITLPATFDFVSTAGYFVWSNLPFPAIAFTGSSPNPSMLHLGAQGSVYIGSLDVVLPTAPGSYDLDVMNVAASHPGLGAALSFGFGPAIDEPVTTWSAKTGELTGGSLLLNVGPYAEDFEAGLGAWTNAGGDVFDWTRGSGGTPSIGTGPSGDHTTGSGWYMYIETSSPRVAGDTAILEIPCFDLGGVSGADLSFWYHMNGSSIGTLNVDVSTDCLDWTNVWTLSGSQGDVWTQATVVLTPFVGTTIKVRFVGIRGSSWAGDIAIDDVSLNVVYPCTTNAECEDGLFCNGAETCDPVLDCQAGSDPCPGQPCDEVGDQCIVAQLESGTVTVGGTAVTVNLTNTYVRPVVVCSVQYNNNTTPVVTRVSGVTGTSFDVRLQNPSGAAVATENVNYLVVEEGSWTIDGVAVDAQTYTSTVTDENNSWVGEAQTYGQAFVDPVIVGQVMSELDPLWSVFWDHGATPSTPPSASSLYTGKTVCEDPTVPRADETIGFIAIETGHGTINGVAFEASIGPKSVFGVDDAPPYAYAFITPFGSAPQVAVVTQAAMIGGDGGWAQTHGATQATTSSLFLSIDEDQLGDAERNHTKEQVFYVVFESPVVYP